MKTYGLMTMVDVFKFDLIKRSVLPLCTKKLVQLFIRLAPIDAYVKRRIFNKLMFIKNGNIKKRYFIILCTILLQSTLIMALKSSSW